MALTVEQKKAFLKFQRNEITESIVYRKLANIEKDEANKKVLLQISKEEKAHYDILKSKTQTSVSPNYRKIIFFYLLARLLGNTFAIKLMESGEGNAHINYDKYSDFEELQQLAKDEGEHENRLIGLINEERLEYMSSIVLGLNDALVEFTGALAGFTLALNDSNLIALTGSITGISAALSMASSEYLSTKSELSEDKHPIKAAIYTGLAYVVTVATLVLPFILISNVLIALSTMLLFALIIIALFNYYYAVTRSEKFKKRFLEMALLSFSVAGISFLIGYALKSLTGIEA